jgi:NADP-dependent aldehyde dehydrogenase
MLEESFDQKFRETLRNHVSGQATLPMLNEDVFQNFVKTSSDLASKLETLAQSEGSFENTEGQIRIFKASAEEFLSNCDLEAEAFGPASIVIIAKNFDEMLAVAKSMEGSLTGSMLVSEEDKPSISALFPVLESKVGRVLWNGFPPGVVPGVATHHGGPWPATTGLALHINWHSRVQKIYQTNLQARFLRLTRRVVVLRPDPFGQLFEPGKARRLCR